MFKSFGWFEELRTWTHGLLNAMRWSTYRMYIWLFTCFFFPIKITLFCDIAIVWTLDVDSNWFLGSVVVFAYFIIPSCIYFAEMYFDRGNFYDFTSLGEFCWDMFHYSTTNSFVEPQSWFISAMQIALLEKFLYCNNTSIRRKSTQLYQR